MYFLFIEKSVLPHTYYNLRSGEKKVLRAFFERIMEEREQEKMHYERLKRLNKR